VLSLLAPGTGQLVLGRRWRGIAFAVPTAIVPLGVLIIGTWAAWAWAALHVIAAIDAGLGVPRPPMRTGAAVAGGGQLAALMIVRALVIETSVVHSSAMEPSYHDDDHVYVAKLGAIDRGDVVMLNDVCGHRATWTSRVVALAGDTVELRCAILYVNGVALPRTYENAYTYDDRVGGGRAERVRASRYREDGHEILLDEDRPALDARATAGDYLMFADAHDFPTANFTGCAAPAGSIDRTTDRPARPCDPQMHYTVPVGTVFVLGDNRRDAEDSRTWGAVPRSLVQGRVASRW
jgi:signal peptidase I